MVQTQDDLAAANKAAQTAEKTAEDAKLKVEDASATAKAASDELPADEKNAGAQSTDYSARALSVHKLQLQRALRPQTFLT